MEEVISTLSSHQLINQTSGNFEYFTPLPIVEAARATMGGIDLDPASCAAANKSINATHYLNKEVDGLRFPWVGRVWMNHPFGQEEQPCKTPCTKKTCEKRGHCVDTYQPGNIDWINKLISEYKKGNITQACCITYACTSEAWFRPLYKHWMCFLYPRTNYIGFDGKPVKGVTKGSVVTYIGPNWRDFARNFSPLGDVRPPLTFFVL